MAAKKGFKQGVDFFLTGEAKNSGQGVSIKAEEQHTSSADNGKYAQTDKYTHTYNNTATRALPARPRGERKTRRLNLLVRPSMYEALAAIAAHKDSSVNDLINNILEDFTAQNSGQIYHD